MWFVTACKVLALPVCRCAQPLTLDAAPLPLPHALSQDRPADVGVSPTKDTGDVRRFLNRLLGAPLGRQALLFSYFAATLEGEIAAARAEGRYSDGVADLAGSHVQRLGEPLLLWGDGGDPGAPGAAATWVHALALDRGVGIQVGGKGRGNGGGREGGRGQWPKATGMCAWLVVACDATLLMMMMMGFPAQHNNNNCQCVLRPVLLLMPSLVGPRLPFLSVAAGGSATPGCCACAGG